MTWIQEHYYDLRTYLRNLFKSSTEEWLEAELMAVDEALGFTAGSTRQHGDRIARIDKLKLELQAERKWSKDLSEMADALGDKIGKLSDEITRLKEIQGARR